MKLPYSHRRREQDGARTITQLHGIAAFSLIFLMAVQASPPSWWASRGAVESGATTNDYAAVNEGQLKQFTSKAVQEMNTNLPGGAGSSLNGLVTGWQADYATNGYTSSNPKPSDFQAMNVGQVKYIGSMIWSQLVAEGYTNAAPSWLDTNAADTSLANIGQLKEVFNFDLVTPVFSQPSGTYNWSQNITITSFVGATLYYTTDGSTPTTTSNLYTGPISVSSTETINVGAFQGGALVGSLVSASYTITQIPILTKTAGDVQMVSASTFASSALVVHVTDGSGTALAGTAVAFTVPSGSTGGLSLTNGGTTATTVNATTDGSGNATIYYQSGPEPLQNNCIVATAGGASVTFTEHCGLQSGLEVWLSADSGLTMDSSNNVSQWVDQAQGLALAQNTSGAQPTYVANSNGSPALNFNGAERISSPATVSLDTDWTIIVAGSSNDIYSERYAVGCGDMSVGNGQRGFGNYVGYNLMALNGGYVASGPFLSAGEDNLMEAVYSSNSSTVNFYDRGQSNGSGSLTTATTTAGFTVGDISNGYYPRLWNGTVHEVLVYNRALGSTERQQVEGYLNDKYGYYSTTATWPLAYSSDVQAEITRNRWTRAQADNYVALQAANPSMLTAGLVAWFKADTGVTQSSGNVSAWADQTGNNPVAQATTGNQPTYVTSDLNGLPALRFNGSQWLYNPHSVGVGVNGDMTMIAVGSTTAPSSLEYYAFLGNATGYTTRGLGYYASYQLFDFTNGDYGLGTSAPVAGTFVVEAATLASNLTSQTFYRNGVQTGTATVAAGQNVTPGLTIGSYNNGSYPFQGDIAEVLVYDHQLSSMELQEVGAYLADKYGLYNPNATWPLAYSSAVQAEITRNQWTKAQADNYVAMQSANPTVLTNGLAAWYRADAGVTQDGSGNVSEWADQAGNYPVYQASSGTKPTYVSSDINGLPALHFVGNQWLFSPARMAVGVNQDMTILSVAETSSPGSLQYTCYLGNSTANGCRGLGYYASDQLFDLSTVYALGEASPSANTFVTEAVTLDSTRANLTFYRNGTQTDTATFSTAQNLSSGIYIGNRASEEGPWQGDIAEVMVYDHKLNSTELQQAGVYLADKYGIYNPNATWPLAYTSDVQAQITANQWSKAQADAYVAFLATNTSVPSTGLELWFKADAGVATDGSGNVTQWQDQSANGFSATPPSSPSEPVLVSNVSNNQSAVQFSGSQTLVGTGAVTMTASEGATIFTVATTTAPGDQRYAVEVGSTSSTGLTRNMGYLDSEQTLGVSLSDAIANTAPNAGTFVEDVSTLGTDGSTVTFYRNGTPTGTSSVSGTGNVTSGFSIGSYISGAYAWKGNIAEVLVYNRVLTSTERLQVDVYLANKYGLYNANANWISSYTTAVQAEINRNEWNKSQADAYVALQSANPTMLTNGLSAWFKADAGVTQSSGNVSSWTDQASGTSLTQTGSTLPTYVSSDVNGPPALRFNGSQWLYNPGNLGAGLNADMTMIAVSQTANPSAHTYSAFLGGSASTSRGIGYDFGDELFDFYDNYALGAASPSDGTFVIEATTLDSARVNAVFYRNGVQTQTAIVSGLENITQGISVGSAANGNFPWQGDLSEVLIYDHKLTSTEMTEVTAYLVGKYGIYTPTAAWISSYTTAVQSEINRNHWTRAQTDAYVAFLATSPPVPPAGLTVWLKPDAGITTNNSSQVTAWADQTVYHNDVAPDVSTNAPTLVVNALNSSNGVSFDGVQSDLTRNILTGLSSGSDDRTMYVVARYDSPGWGGIGYGTNAYNQYFGVGVSDEGYTMVDDNGDGIAMATPLQGAGYVIQSAVVASNNVSLYQNGSLTGNQSWTYDTPVAGSLVLGENISGSPKIKQTVCEVLIYSRALNSTEQQQVGLYLEGKYNLPYYGLSSLSISPASGSYTGTLNVTISGSVSGSTIHYTLDGTQPMIGSPTYTSAIALTGSALVQAQVFVDGAPASPVASTQYYVNDSGETGLPTTATDLSVTSTSSHKVNLSWELTGESNYSGVQIYRSVNGGAYQLLTTLGASALSYTDYNVVPGSSYQYYVATVNSSGQSATAHSSTVSLSSPSTLNIILTTPSDATSYP